MMIVLSSYTIHMHRDPRSLRKALQAMRYHLCRQVTDLFPLELQICNAEGTIREVDDGA